jgi:hypothetical protein
MPNQWPSQANQAAHSLEAGIWFYRAVFTLVSGTVARVCNNSEDSTILGDVYHNVPFEVGPLRLESAGAIPERTIKVSNVQAAEFFTTQILEQDGIAGAKCEICEVFYDEPNIDTSNVSQIYEVLSSEPNYQSVVIRLGGPSLLRQQFPLFRYRNAGCRVVNNYKGIECGATSELTTCDGTVANCIARSNYARIAIEEGLRPNLTKLV